jgi:AGZA family xanthine/uracil permease-like MFS transporter
MKIFNFRKYNTTISQEILAGVTTFCTMAYIIVVNPKILEVAGMPFGASMVATILTAFFGCMAMGLYANRPFAIAPYMGANAFIAFTVVKILGFTWQQALGAVFISGVLFTLLTLFKLRSWLANAIPECLKIAFSVGIGLFLTFIGLNQAGIVVLGVPGAPVKIGNITSPQVLLAILGFLIMSVLMVKKVKGSILLSILFITFLSFVFNLNPLPKHFFSLPPSLADTFFKLDIKGALTISFFPVILTLLIMDFVDTMGTLIGVAYLGGFLDEKGELPEIEKPMLCDACSTVFASIVGTTTAGAYIESATGIEAGGKTGFASIITGALFLLSLFFAPILSKIPAYAYGPALIMVGVLMFSPVSQLNFKDLSEIIPSFMTIVLICFTYDIGIGITAGFIVYVFVKIVSGKIKDISSGMWVLSMLSLIFYIFNPH